MARMNGRMAAQGVNGLTKSQCSCGRRGCSDIRSWQGKSFKKVDKADFRNNPLKGWV